MVPDHRDLAGVHFAEQPVLQDLLCAQLVAPVHQRHVLRDVRQVQRLLDRSVAAADHRHAVPAEEEAVAGCARRHSAAAEFLLRRQPQIFRGRTGRDDQRIAAVVSEVAPEHEGSHREIHRLHVVVHDLGGKALSVALHALHQCRPLQTLDITRPGDDIGRGHQLTALLDARDQQRCAIGARGVDRCAVARGPGAQNDEAAVTGARHEYLTVPSPIMAAIYLKTERRGLAETSVQARNASRFTSAVSRGLRESAIIALAIVALVLFMALATYSPDDPGFSFTGTSGAVHNRIGVIGAWVADVLFFLFGWLAFLFPLVLGAACWGLQRRMRTATNVSRANTLVRILGFALVLVASCALTTLHWQPGVLRESAGGVVGKAVGVGLASGVDFLGATLLMVAAWMAGLSLAFGVSWFTIMDRVGAAAGAGIGFLRARWSSSRDAAEGRERRQARKESVESAQKKSATRAPPRIEAPAPVLEK